MPHFEIDVLSNPAVALGIEFPHWKTENLAAFAEYDANLIKPALLFGDRVNLVTYRETMRELAANRGQSFMARPMQRIMAYLAVSARANRGELEFFGLNPSELPSPTEAKALMSGNDYEEFNKYWEEHENQVESFAKKEIKLAKDNYNELNMRGLSSLVDAGVLTVEGWATIPPKLRGWPVMEEAVVEASVLVFLDRLANSNAQPMLDVGADWIVKNWPLLPDHLRSAEQQATSWRGPTMTAANAVMRLPGLDRLTLEEVSDLRSEIAKYLPAFRAEMIKLGEDLSEASIEPEKLTAEVDKRWYRDIAPALEEIRRDVAAAAYPRRLLNTITAQKDAMVSTGGAIVLATGSVAAGISTLAPAALAAAYPLAKALNDMMSSRSAIKKNRLYFLYALEKGVQKRLC